MFHDKEHKPHPGAGKQKKLVSVFIFNGLLLIAAFILIQYSVISHESGGKAAVPSDKIEPVMQGRVAEAFTLYETPQTLPEFVFKTSFDKEIALDDLKGQWIVLNFWATWCPPCLVEMPSLQAMQDAFSGQGIKVVAVSLDRGMDGEKLRAFMTDKNFGPVAAYYDPQGGVMRQLSLRGLPSTLILAPDGRAIGIFEGDADWMSEDVRAFITSLLTPAQR